MTYKYRSGFRCSVRAEDAAHHLEKLRKANGGRLATETVLDDARDPASPIHKCFTWDDEKAAERWRVWQARRLIGAIVVVYDEAPDAEPVRAYVNLKDADEEEGGNAYLEVRGLLKDESGRKLLVEKALAELAVWQAKHDQLHELSEVFAAAARARKTNQREPARPMQPQKAKRVYATA